MFTIRVRNLLELRGMALVFQQILSAPTCADLCGRLMHAINGHNPGPVRIYTGAR